MTTRVVNIRANAPHDVYIGRGGHGHDGYFGNPVRVGETCAVCGNVHRERSGTLPCFRRYFFGRLSTDPVFAARVLLLRDRTLGCFCKPDVCHGDVVADWLDTYTPVHVIGFTGTRIGMTEAQYRTVGELVRAEATASAGRILVGMHGDCVGADHHFDHVCETNGVLRWKRPGNLAGFAANTTALAIERPKDPLTRNEEIAIDSRLLLACPKGQDEELRSGTWATVRRAYKLHRKIIIITPDGQQKGYKDDDK